MSALGMCDSGAAEDFRQFSVIPGPEGEMSMIRHKAIGDDADLGLSVGLGENLFKYRVVSGCLKEGKSSNMAIQDVISEVASGAEWTAQHTGSCNESETIVHGKILNPFYRTLDTPLRVFQGIIASTVPMEAVTAETGKMLVPAMVLPRLYFSSVTTF